MVEAAAIRLSMGQAARNRFELNQGGVMRFLSIFSGIEAASVAWEPLGFEPVAFAENDKYCSALLRERYPNVPNLGDVTRITEAQLRALPAFEILIGGSPCQDLSVAGKRAGLGGERSGLFFEQQRIFHAARAIHGTRYQLWENVPGAFSLNQGRDFAVVVGAMAGTTIAAPGVGWGSEGVALGDHGLVEWAVLDAQWFGLAQRRRRVFALLDTGDWWNRRPILLERDGLRGDHPPCREPGQRTAERAAGGADGCGGDEPAGPAAIGTVAKALAASDGGVDRDDRHTLIADSPAGSR